jgi:DNA-binding PadR family transcriptional regulator
MRQIADRPAHGYDLIRSIATKTDGAWKPGAGSIYPILKELVAEKFIKEIGSKESWRSQRVYQITSEGRKYLEHSHDMMMKAGKNWEATRNIMIDLIDPEHVPTIVPHMASGQFAFLRQIIELKRDKIPKQQIKLILKEYALNLERQMSWTNRMRKQS